MIFSSLFVLLVCSNQSLYRFFLLWQYLQLIFTCFILYACRIRIGFRSKQVISVWFNLICWLRRLAYNKRSSLNVSITYLNQPATITGVFMSCSYLKYLKYTILIALQRIIPILNQKYHFTGGAIKRTNRFHVFTCLLLLFLLYEYFISFVSSVCVM